MYLQEGGFHSDPKIRKPHEVKPTKNVLGATLTRWSRRVQPQINSSKHTVDKVLPNGRVLGNVPGEDIELQEAHFVKVQDIARSASKPQLMQTQTFSVSEDNGNVGVTQVGYSDNSNTLLRRFDTLEKNVHNFRGDFSEKLDNLIETLTDPFSFGMPFGVDTHALNHNGDLV